MSDLWRGRLPRRLPAALLLAALLPGPALANAPGLACQAAIAVAEREHGIPDGLLQSIGLVESGQRSAETGARLPWPWAVNAAGEGQLAPDRAAAIALVVRAQGRGLRSIDVGCLQINLLHHPQAFASLEQAFDPLANARYGGSFLLALRNRLGNWPAAVAQYHSAEPTRGAEYQARVMAQWSGTAALPPPLPRMAAVPVRADAHAPLWSSAGLAVAVYRPTTTVAIIPARTARHALIQPMLPPGRNPRRS
jgi:hypothetical protein